MLYTIEIASEKYGTSNVTVEADSRDEANAKAIDEATARMPDGNWEIV
jgi:hypothetical protein